MGKANFPLINARRDIFNHWHLCAYIGDNAETIVVPSSPNEYGQHTVWLTEIPDGSAHVKIEGLRERTSNATPNTVAQDEFYVNYQTGEIFFNALQAGNEFKAEYFGKGSLVESDDINNLNERLIAVENVSTDAIQTKLDDFVSTLTELNNQITDISGSTIELQRHREEDRTQIDEHSERIISAFEKIDEMGPQIRDLTSDLNSQKEKVNSLEENIDFNAISQVSENINKISNLENSVLEINTSISTNTTKISEIETDISNNLSNLETLISGNSEQITSLNEKIENIPDNSEEVSKVSGDIVVVLNRLANVEDKMDALRYTNIEAVVVDPEVKTISDPEKDVVISGGDSVLDGGNYSVTGKSIELKNVAVSNQYSVMTASTDVTIKGMESSGTLDRSITNAQIQINANEYVTIKDSSLGQNGYNCVEIGLGNSSPKSVLIDNCEFKSALSNNGVSIFGWQDNAVITISNCYFENVSNVLRLSNKYNSKNAVVNFVNCKMDKWESGSAYAGPVICQDYTSVDPSTKKVSEELVTENNLFGPEKLTINFINCIGPNGIKIDRSDLEPDKYLASADDNQVCYVYGASVVPYSEDRYPVVNFS